VSKAVCSLPDTPVATAKWGDYVSTSAPAGLKKARNEDNRVRPEDRAAHEWYRFVLSYPPHLVRDYLKRLDVKTSETVLDPFCGTGTTLVECRKLGIASVGLEVNRKVFPIGQALSLVYKGQEDAKEEQRPTHGMETDLSTLWQRLPI